MPHITPQSAFEDLVAYAISGADESITETLAFLEGDHWQDGAAWIGPMPGKTHKEYDRMFTEIKNGFVSGNKIKEIIERHLDGCLKVVPDWQLIPLEPSEDGTMTSEQVAAADEVNAWLVDWWDDHDISRIFRKVARNLLVAQRGVARLHIPSGLLGKNYSLPSGEIVDMLDLVHLDAPTHDHARVHTNPSNKLQLGVLHYEEETPEGEEVEDRLEVTFLDAENKCVIRILKEDEGAGEFEVIGETIIDLGGRLTMCEVSREDPFITPQIKQSQKLFNLAMTMLQRNVIIGGFLERVITGAQAPGHYEKDPTSPTGERFIVDPNAVGAGQTTYLAGVPIRDESGRITGYTSPGVNYRDPVSITTFEETKQSAYMNILTEARQLHAAMGGDATASGKSRVQARGDFENSLSETKTLLEKLGHWLIETVLHLAAALSGQPAMIAGFRIVFDVTLDLGPAEDSELNFIMGAFDKGLLSERTTMVKIGIEDPDAELEQKNREKQANMERARAMGLTPGLDPNNNDPDADDEDEDEDTPSVEE